MFFPVNKLALITLLGNTSTLLVYHTKTYEFVRIGCKRVN